MIVTVTFTSFTDMFYPLRAIFISGGGQCRGIVRALRSCGSTCVGVYVVCGRARCLCLCLYLLERCPPELVSSGGDEQ